MWEKSNRGFTFIELMVVIAIIGVLSAIILGSLNIARAKGRDARRVVDMQEIRKALYLYLLDHGDFPTPTTSSSGSLAGWEVSYLPDFMEYLLPYFSQIPVDPINSGPPSSMFNPRPDGSFFYTYYYYAAGSAYGCSWSGPFAILGFRSAEAGASLNLAKAQCGPQPCPGGGVPNVCRDWSTEFDYSVFSRP